ncbi:MAG TPA: hypothetical protein VNL98_11765, partial [Gemmatimonadales bacterium]|nr:hypothetical protein [Gemmatimonadales bacterium]
MISPFRAYAALVVAFAAIVATGAGWSVGSEPTAHFNAFASFLVLGFLSEASYLKLRVERVETQSSVSFIPFLASVLLFDSGWAASIAAVSVLGVELTVRRKPFDRALFNTAQVFLSVALAAFAYRALGGTPALERSAFPIEATVAAVAVYFLVNSTAVSVAVSLGEGIEFTRSWLRIAGGSLFYDLATSLLAPLLAFLYTRYQ